MIRLYIVIVLTLSIFIVSISFGAEISISRIDDNLLSYHKVLTVSIDSNASEIGSFNLTVAYDPSNSFVYAVRPGDIYDSCNWEYFNYRLIPKDTVITTLPNNSVQLINVKGIASTSGATSPNCEVENVTLFEIGLVLSHSSPYADFIEEVFIPFRFFWRDCTDNILVSKSGDTVYSALTSFENLNQTQTHVSFNSAFPGYGFPQSACPAQQYVSVSSTLSFVNSGIRTVNFNYYSDCDAGDVNLNGIRYEIADVIEFINFFTYGICGFSCCWGGPPCEAMIAQTDCNCDGTVLTVGDLVCFIRKAIGDVEFNKIPVTPESNALIYTNQSNNSQKVSLSTDADVALTYLRVIPKYEDQLRLDDFNFGQPLIWTGQIGDTITLMLVNLDGSPVLTAGQHQLFEYSGNSQLDIEAWVVDMNGQEIALKLESAVLPVSPELLQNYPNPFNPSTTIEFNLPAKSEWKLEIYNVAGQLIKNYSGNSTRLTKIEWDGTGLGGAPVSSGVYFYKLISGENTTSRKMLLLK